MPQHDPEAVAAAAPALLTAVITAYNDLGLIFELDTERNTYEVYVDAVRELVGGVGTVLNAALKEAGVRE
jgi:hypothetical protein